MSNGVFLLLQTLSLWPVWSWYLSRLTDRSDEPWGVLALITALIFCLSRRDVHRALLQPARVEKLAAPLALMLLYAVTFSHAPALIRAIIAITAWGLSLSVIFLNKRLHLGMSALLVLSLPLIASLQFFLGYPIRLATSHLCAALLSGFFEPVQANGTLLAWRGELIAVDAPCSGIKMLWAGLYLNFTLACFSNLGFRSTWASYLMSSIVIFCGNLLRTLVLFHSESGLIPNPPWFHNTVGLVVFVFVVILIFRFHRFLGGRHAFDSPSGNSFPCVRMPAREPSGGEKFKSRFPRLAGHI